VATSLTPRFGQLLDRWAVLLARDHLVSLISQARAVAQVRGGADLVLETATGRAAIEIDGESVATLDLRPWRVSVSAGSGRDSVLLRFDALGIGRIASQTLRLSRGAAEAQVIISSFGRVRIR
jgi:hypothetical protein